MAHLERVVRLAREVGFTLRKFPIESFELPRLAEAATFFDEHGWVILKNVFSPSEVDGFRADVLASQRDRMDGDLLGNPRLGRFILDGRTLSIARALVGAPPTYFGDSSWSSSNVVPQNLGFHKDNADKLSDRGPDWVPRKFPILRMGVYLQDHVEHSGGLGLRDRSHHTHDCSVGTPFAAPTAKGDVVVWSLRTSHTGFASRLRVFPSAFVPMGVQGRLAMRVRGDLDRPRLLFRASEHPDRVALFSSFGADGPLLRRFLRYLKTRRYAIELWRSTEYSEAIRAEAARKGLGLIDAPAEAKGIDPMSVFEEHRELPADS